MRRRDLLAHLAAISVFPEGLWAQSRNSSHVTVGILSSFAEADREAQRRLAAFRRGLSKAGWSEPDNLRIVARHSPNANGADELARELLEQRPDVIFANSTPIVRSLQLATRSVPVVFVGVSDPIGSGFIKSLSHPGGNFTGLLLHEEGIAGKWVMMLKEAAPHITKIALCANPETTPYDYFWRSVSQAARTLSLEAHRIELRSVVEIEHAMSTLSTMGEVGLVFPSDSTITSHRDLIIALAARNKLPAVYSLRLFPAAGGLMSYGTDRVAEFEQAAHYVDRILRGTSPSELPVQAPRTYRTVLNLNAARDLGLEVSPTLLVRADEVIE